MKNFTSIQAQIKAFLILALVTFAQSNVMAQSDTLHLYYHYTSTKLVDSTEAKIDQWIKKLNGKHMDVIVAGYYNKPEFKKFATERTDELFLILNRKARSLITIEYIGPKKGEHYQRTTVDIIYKPTVTAAQAAEIAAKEKAEEAKKKEDASAEKVAKDKEKKEAAEKKKAAAPAVAVAEGANVETGKSEKEKKNEKEKSVPTKTKEKKVEPAAVNGSPGIKPAGKGLYVTEEDRKRIKSAKLIISKTDDPEIDAMLEYAVKNYWKFNDSIISLTYKEAKALAKINPNVLVFIVTDIKSTSLTHGSGNDRIGNTGNLGADLATLSKSQQDNYKTVSYGSSVMLEDGKGKIALASYFPTFGDEKMVTPEAVAFAVSVMNSLLSSMEQYNINNNMTVNKPYSNNAAKLKEKTLLLPDGWLHEKLNVAEISNYYKAKFEVADYEKWSEAILKKADYAYAIVVPVPIGGDFVYQHYLMDATTGMVFYVSQPKAATKIQGINVSKANTGYINSKNLENYNKAFEKGEAKEDEKESGAGEVKKEEVKKEEPAKKEESKKEDKKKKSKKEEESSPEQPK